MHDSPARASSRPLSNEEKQISSQQERDLVTVAKGGGISFAGTAVTRVVNYLYSLVLVWGLGGENFGLYILALAVINFIGVVAELGLGLSIVRFGAIDEARERSNIHKITMSALGISLPVTLIFLAAIHASANAIAVNIFQKPELSMLLKILAWSIPLMAIQSLLTAAAKARKLVQYSAFVWMMQSLSAFILAILFIALGWGLVAVVISFVLSYALGATLAIIFYLRVIPRQVNADPLPLAQMVKFSLPLTLTRWIQFANERTEILFLGLLPGALSVGIYKIAWSLAGLETMLRLSLEEILAPFSSALSHRKEIGQLGALYKTTAKWSFTAALLLAFLYLLIGETILRIFDPAFAVGLPVLIALALAQLFNEATGACGTILIMSGRSDLSLLNTIVLFASSVTLDWILIPRFGLGGAAFAGAFTIILVNIMRVTEVWAILKIHPFSWSFLKPVCAGLAGGAFVWAIRSSFSVSLILDILYGFVFVFIYILCIWLLRLDADDLVIITAVTRKLAGVWGRLKGAA